MLLSDLREFVQVDRLVVYHGQLVELPIEEWIAAHRGPVHDNILGNALRPVRIDLVDLVLHLVLRDELLLLLQDLKWILLQHDQLFLALLFLLVLPPTEQLFLRFLVMVMFLTFST